MAPTVVAIRVVAISVAQGLVLLARSGDVTMYLLVQYHGQDLDHLHEYTWVLDMALPRAPLPPEIPSNRLVMWLQARDPGSHLR